MRGLVVASVTLLAAPAVADDRVVRGVVVDRATGAPIDATIIGASRTANTAKDGTFSIAIGSGEHDLVAIAPGYAMRVVPLGNFSTLRIVMAASTTEVIEVSGRAPRAKAIIDRPLREAPAAQTYHLTSEDLRILPGTANDALRATQVLPGVARLPFSFGGIVLRGTSPRDNVVFLDGIEVPLAFHFGGVTSFYPSGMLDGLTVNNGGIDVEYGRAQGGMVSMSSREPRTDRWRTGGSVGLLDSSVFAEGPLRGGGVLIGMRRSYFDIVAAPVASEDTPMPSYWDAQIRMSFGHPRWGGRITPMLFMAIDQMSQSKLPEGEMYEEETEITNAFARVAVPYLRQEGPVTFRVVPWFGTNQLAFRSRFKGDTETFNRPVYPGGLRADIARDYSWGHLRGGLDAAGAHVTHFQAGLGHTGDVIMQINGETTVDWIDAALWAEGRYDFGRIGIKPGIRLEHYGLTSEEVFDPRLSLYQRLTETITLRETVGRYHQPPTPGDVDPNGGNPRLVSSYFDSASIGVDGVVGDGWSGSFTTFFSYGERLGVRRPITGPMDFEQIGSLGSTFSLLLEKQLGLAFERDAVGRARNYGIEVLVKRTIGNWFGLFAYTFANAERTDNPMMSLGWRPFELDQRHNLNVAASYKWNRWRFGARVQLVSGTPYRMDESPDWDKTLPTFFQLDVRADRSWPQCWGDITLFFDIQNATNHYNVEGREPDGFGGERDVRGLPIMPFIGLEMTPH